MKSIVVLITCDTKPEEAAYLKKRIEQMGLKGVIADTSTKGDPGVTPDICREDLSALGGIDFNDITNAGSRGAAVGKMAEALMTALKVLHKEGRLDGVICVGGAGSFIGAPAMQELPLGVPKVVVSPLASGPRTFGQFVGSSDMMVMHSVIDIAGMNDISRTIYDNAAAAVCGMVIGQDKFDHVKDDKKCIGVTMMGTTTPGAMAAVRMLEAAGYLCIIFHASGVGGSSMEKFVREKRLAGVLEFSLAEMMGTHVGGMTKTNPERLSVTGEHGLPQVVTTSAIDFINLFPQECAQYPERIIYNHNPQTPLMRATKEEMLVVAEKIALQLNKAKGSTTVVAPLRGLSDPNKEGGLFWDPESDAAFRAKLKADLNDNIKYVEVDAWVNDKEFGEAAAKELLAIL